MPLTLLSSNVRPEHDASYWQGIAGEAIAPGEAVYLSQRDGLFYLATSQGSVEASAVLGLAMNEADFAGQAVRLQTSGLMHLVATPVIQSGLLYVLGSTPGSIISVYDLANGDWVTTLGIGGLRNEFHLHVFASLERLGGALDPPDPPDPPELSEANYWAMLDQEGTTWYFWFEEDVAGPHLVRNTTVPGAPYTTALTTGTPPSWHEVTDELNTHWFLYPENTGELAIHEDPPPLGAGLVFTSEIQDGIIGTSPTRRLYRLTSENTGGEGGIVLLTRQPSGSGAGEYF